MALNIFAGEKIYDGWTKKGNNVPFKDAVDAELFSRIDNEAEVTESDRGFGKSVCFYLNGGRNRVFKALSTTSKLNVGDKISKDELYVTVLSKPGSEDIYRITEEA